MGVGLVFKAHRLLYHSTPGSRVIKREFGRRSFDAACDGVFVCERWRGAVFGGWGWGMGSVGKG